MENIEKLYIDTHKEEVEEVVPKDIRFKNLGYFFDKRSKIGIQKKYIECDLKVGFAYDFTYEGCNDTDTYCYVVLKRNGNIYYIAEYYGKFYEDNETLLGDCWIKCDVKEELGIDIDEWKTTKICNAQTPDMRLKVEEYIAELDAEIDRCTLWIEENMSSDACVISEMKGRLKALTEVKNDLQSRLEELV